MFILRPDASVFLFTPCWDEPFGLPAIEAMCTGLPVGAVAMGAVHEVVGKACTYASPDDAAGLAQALLAAMDIRPKIPARRIRAHFSLDRMLDRYVALYEAARTGESAASPRRRRSFPPIELQWPCNAKREAIRPVASHHEPATITAGREPQETTLAPARLTPGERDAVSHCTASALLHDLGLSS